MVGKFEVGKKVDLGKLSRESDGLESCSREKDVAPQELETELNEKFDADVNNYFRAALGSI